MEISIIVISCVRNKGLLTYLLACLLACLPYLFVIEIVTSDIFGGIYILSGHTFSLFSVFDYSETS